MDNDAVVNSVTDETKAKLRDFDEEEAYFLLCEIFSYAQATKDYAKFQTDLNEWKKRYPIDLFSENLKRKIKYMLSKEFLDTILKGFMAFDELSKKNPLKGLEELRKILDRAEKHKDEKRLDKDLENLYSEYPLKYLTEKYPHIVPMLVSKSNRTRILEKFDSELAFKELTSIVEHPENYSSKEDFKATISEWQKLYPTYDFNDEYKSEVDRTLNNSLDENNLSKIFSSLELNLSEGQIITIDPTNLSKVSKDALYDFFKIVDKNKGDIDGLFHWICKYSKYINTFDNTIKDNIVSNLMSKYAYDMPPSSTNYRIPKMDSSPDELLSLRDYSSIEGTKKDVVIQLLGILSTGDELTPEDRYRLNTIDENVQKATIIKKAKIEPKLDLFMEKFPEDKLTPSDEIYLNTSVSGGNEVAVQEEEVESDTLSVPTILLNSLPLHQNNDMLVELDTCTVEQQKEKNANPSDEGKNVEIKSAMKKDSNSFSERDYTL